MSNLTFTGQRLPSATVADFDKLLASATAAVEKPRPYTARLSRTNPTAFVFLLDQSGSMSETLETRKGEVRKSEFLADAVNDLLNQLISECRRSGEYRNYMDICVIGYGGDADDTAKYAWEGDLKDKSFVTILELKAHPIDKNGSRGVWLTARAERLTPMLQAIELAHDTLAQWLASHAGKDIFPPVVINMTDGVATDADSDELIAAARKLKALKTMDGNVLFYNVHLSGGDDEELLFPCREEELPDDEYAHTLFSMSSDLPSVYNTPIARITQRDASPNFTAMAYNVNPIQIVNLLNIGTSVTRRQA